MKYSHHILGISLIGITSLHACSNKKDDDTQSTASTVAYSTKANAAVHLAQTFTANTPKSFTATTALQRTALVSACTTEFGQGSAAATACETMSDIQQRFFGAGPTVIKDRLADLDLALNSALEQTSSSYVPCLDTQRSSAGTFPISKEGGSTDITFDAYSLTAIALKSTFKNGYAIDTGDSVSLSCFSADSAASAKAGIGTGYGYKDGTWSLYQLGAQAIGMFGTADQHDAINMWFRIGSNSPSQLSTQAAGEVAGSAFYNGSTGIVQIISNPQTGLVGLTQVGSGIGPGCGARLLMNGTSLYFDGNVNNYGACTASDYDANPTNGQPAYSASRSSVKVCMDVSGTTVLPTTGFASCVKSGLISLDDNGDPVSPFEAAGLKNLTADMGSSSSAVIKARAWMGAFFMSDTDLSAIAPFGWVTPQANETVKVEGFSRSSYAFTRTTLPAKQSSSVTAACNAASADQSATVEETFELNVSDLLKAEMALRTDASEDSILAEWKSALTNTGDSAAMISLSVTGIRGTTYHSGFEGTVTASLDGASVGTGTLALPPASGPMLATADVRLGSSLVLTNTSKFTVAVSGTLALSCDSSNAIVRTVAVKPGLPALVLQVKQKE